MQWGKKWPVQMNLPFFAVEAYVPGGVQNQAEKNVKKCLPAGTGTKIYFSSHTLRIRRPHNAFFAINLTVLVLTRLS